MAGAQQARSDFTEILTSLERKFEIILLKWVNDKDFEIRIRTEIDHNNDDFNGLCDQWVEMFTNATNTVWVKKISNTGPKIRFRKQYQCWTHGGGKVQKELLFDARRCRGVLDMKVLTDTPLTRRKNKHIRMGLNAVVKINFNHLHPVNTEVPFAFFVHNCPQQPEPLPLPPLPTIPTTTSLQPIKISTNAHQQLTAVPISIASADLSEPLLMCQPTIMFDTSTMTHTLTLPHHVMHSHAHVHHNQQPTPHGHYL